VAPVGAGEGPLALRLVLIVELLHHAQAQLLRDGLGVESGRDRPRQAHDHAGVPKVRHQRFRHPGILDLHCDRAPVVKLAAVHLPD